MFKVGQILTTEGWRIKVLSVPYDFFKEYKVEILVSADTSNYGYKKGSITSVMLDGVKWKVLSETQNNHPLTPIFSDSFKIGDLEKWKNKDLV